MRISIDVSQTCCTRVEMRFDDASTWSPFVGGCNAIVSTGDHDPCSPLARMDEPHVHISRYPFQVYMHDAPHFFSQMKNQSHDIIQGVKKRMLEALYEREDIASRVHFCRIEGRTKALVSTFRKVQKRGKQTLHSSAVWCLWLY